MYEKIFNKLKSLGVYETLEELNLELNQAMFDSKTVKETLENLKTIYDSDSHFRYYDTMCSYEVDESEDFSSILKDSLELKIENIEKKIVSIEEKIEKAKEDVKMMYFLKNIIKDTSS